MSTPSIQHLLAEALLRDFPDALIKKIDSDNFLDIHVPSIHPKKGTHIFFNTSKQSIKLGFYCREEEWVQQALSNGGDLLEEYAQGIRLKGNPEFTDVETAITATLEFIEALGQKLTPSSPAKKTKTETYTFKNATDAYLKGNLEYVAAYVQAGNSVLQFNGDTLITNELVSYVCAFTEVDQRIVDLVEAGVDLDSSFDDGEGYTAVHYAAWDGKDEILAYLLDAGAEADLVGEDGYSPLLLAVAGGYQACVELLVENGADVNRRINDSNIYFSKQGGTPLTVAFINGFLETALFLIDNGADPFVLLEPCKKAPSPNLFVNFLSLVEEGEISPPEEGQLSKILSLVGQDTDENLIAEDSSDDEVDSEEDNAAEDDEENELAYPMISWWGENINQEKLENYVYKWQTKSEAYGWVGGISGFTPDWFEAFISDAVCPSFTTKELLAISNRVLNEKIIPVLNYAPEELFLHVKSVWWIVPFCIWKEDTASFVFIDKNGFYSFFENKNGEVDIKAIFPWDKVSSLEFEREYASDPNVNRLTLFQDNGGFLTFDEFVGLGEDGKDRGSYLAVVESIWEARKDTIEASAGVPMWYEGKGGEGFVEFEKPQELLKESKWKKPFRPDASMYEG